MILSTDYIITFDNKSVLFNNFVNKFDVTFWITVSYYHLYFIHCSLSHILYINRLQVILDSVLVHYWVLQKRTHLMDHQKQNTLQKLSLVIQKTTT